MQGEYEKISRVLESVKNENNVLKNENSTLKVEITLLGEKYEKKNEKLVSM